MSDALIKKRYLGDGVYGHFDGWHVVLTVGQDDDETQQMICLDRAVLRALDDYAVELALVLPSERQTLKP